MSTAWVGWSGTRPDSAARPTPTSTSASAASTGVTRRRSTSSTRWGWTTSPARRSAFPLPASKQVGPRSVVEPRVLSRRSSLSRPREDPGTVAGSRRASPARPGRPRATRSSHASLTVSKGPGAAHGALDAGLDVVLEAEGTTEDLRRQGEELPDVGGLGPVRLERATLLVEVRRDVD